MSLRKVQILAGPTITDDHIRLAGEDRRDKPIDLVAGGCSAEQLSEVEGRLDRDLRYSS